jgi:glutamate dehydrogenase
VKVDTTLQAELEKELEAYETSWHPGHPREREVFRAFVRAFVQEAERSVIFQHPHRVLLEELEDSLRFIARRPTPQILVRVFNPSRPETSSLSGRTVIETLMPDQPFLLDTLHLYLNRAGLRERLCCHPILKVRRGREGLIEDLVESADGGAAESFIHVETDIVEPHEHPVITERVHQLLTQVQVVCDDFSEMLKVTMDAAANLEEYAERIPGRRTQAKEGGAFLHWLMDDHFVFLGCRDYDVSLREGAMEITLRRGTGLGIGRNEARSRYFRKKSGSEIPQRVKSQLANDDFILIDKSTAFSPVRRGSKIDHITVKRVSQGDQLVGFMNILGLFTHPALEEPGSAVPILRQKLSEVLATTGGRRGSHDYKAAVAAFDSIPLEYLFLSSPEEIAEDIRLIAAAQVRNEVGLNLSREPAGRFLLVMLILPAGKYSEELREQIESYLADCCHAAYSHHRVSFTEFEAAVVAFYFTAGDSLIPELDSASVLERIRTLAQSWEERLLETLEARHGISKGMYLFRRHAHAFPESYRVSHPAPEACCDIDRLEAALEAGELQLFLARDLEEDGDRVLHLHLYGKTDIHLADSMPVLDNHGLRVAHQIPTEVQPANAPRLYINTFQIEDRWRGEEDLSPLSSLLRDSIRAVLGEAVDNDPLNRLVLDARVSWREIDVLRAYVAYAHQIGLPFSSDFYREVLIKNTGATLALLSLFRAQFDPDLEEASRAGAVEENRNSLEETLRAIDNFNEDKVLRSIYNFIESTVRTNFYRRRSDPYFLSLKIEGARVERLPLPRPAYELIVRGRQMEGVHLRCGRVARGGIRWSDRVEDYRREILDLMKTQQVKNALIVPFGAKGGFVLKVKDLPPEQSRKLADESYETLIRGFLDVTDNFVEGRVVHPEKVVVRDEDDPYLVVAADKGTAHLSDSANRITEQVGFWLGDAFASGGSRGYDHKREGITAKGAWTCVRRHFLELGVDLDVSAIRVVGIGDMAGDVFGNAMLLSRRMKLVAAFNHMHIFLDPDPDPERSYLERRRLFQTETSSWGSYDRAAISHGGGVYRRQAKAVPLTPEVKAMLGVEADSLGGEELIRAILCAEVDLIWNGGIGTYIKSSRETPLNVGDKANDGARVDASDVRAKVIGEGGNLGVTQRGRIDLAKRGVRINTDAIDNSAGVDLSDHEVNLKIGLQQMIRKGSLGGRARDPLLEEVKAEVCKAVTGHNWSQSRLISLDERRSIRGIEEFIWLIETLEEEDHLNRRVDLLPTTENLSARRKKGAGLTRPELAILVGQAKIDVYRRLLASELLMTPPFEALFDAYFPEALRRVDPVALREHPLRREITATQICNHIVDWAGVTFFGEFIKETQRDAGEIAAAYLLSEDVLGAQPLRRALEATGFDVPVTTRYDAYLLIEDTLVEAVRWVLPILGVPERWRDLVGEHRSLLEEAAPVVEEILSPSRKTMIEERFTRLREGGLPEGLARRVATFRRQLRLIGMGRIAHEAGYAAGWSLEDVGRLYFTVGEETQIDWMLLRMADAPKPTEWDKIAYGALRGELILKQHEIVVGIIRGARPGTHWEDAWRRYRDQQGAIIDRLIRGRREIEAARVTRFTPFSVLGQIVKSLPLSS